MELDKLGPDAWKILEETLGYVNFSSGISDPRFLRNVNELFQRLEAQHPKRPSGRARSARSHPHPTWKELCDVLRAALERLQGSSDVFRQVDQARAVIGLVFDQVLPGYRKFHRDLLFHQTDEGLFGPLFLGRVFEAVLRQGAPWDATQRIVDGAIGLLNDYIGHRPVAVLQNERKHQPYAHEWVRPIPIFIRGAGAAVGRYQDLVVKALEILESTERDLLQRAWFHPEWLDELAIDPRAYDFDHPANKRPNYHFGQWDPHAIDNAGRYRRFVVPQVTIDAILEPVEKRGRTPRHEALFEAAAVLAGTILMASGVSGSGPGTHDSSVSLGTLLPHVAAYRDDFYQRLIARLTGPHLKRLQAEAANLRQPFGGARQHLNQALAKRRAMQLQHSHLAQLYAWMGYTDAAMQQAEIVPVASARISCQIFCRLTLAHLAIDRGELDDAAAALPEVEDLLHRGIECGALADPWNMLGFGGQFSLFPAVENSIHDHRVDELIDLVADVFDLYTRLLKESAAAGNTALPGPLSQGMEQLAAWWDQFASTTIGDIEGFSGRESFESATHVAAVLEQWHAAGTAAGDVAFWRKQIDRFHSPKAYALVVESLLEQRDLVASMALLIQWLGQSESVTLIEQDFSFHDLAIEWMDELLDGGRRETHAPTGQAATPQDRWALARKMLDYMEANAESYWHVPQFELDRGRRRGPALPQETDDERGEADDEEDEGPDELFAAAYEDMTFRDSADDGFEGEMMHGGEPITDFELATEADRLGERLYFLTTLARLWKMAASALGTAPGVNGDRAHVLESWLAQAEANRRQLSELMDAVDGYRIPAPRGTHESMVEYDQRRGLKEHVLEQIIATSVETADASRSLRAAQASEEPPAKVAGWEGPAQRVLGAVFRGDAAAARSAWPALRKALAREPLLYVALARGGNPRQIVASRSMQRVLRRLLAYLPRLGLLEETFQLLETIHDMERNHSVGPGAITEFDQMFEIACRGMVRCLVIFSENWRGRASSRTPSEHAPDIELIGYLERAIEGLLQVWLNHSRRVRLSVLETVTDDFRWRQLRAFVEAYGHDLFTQRFMNMGNLRGILHQGVDAWLKALETEDDPEMEGSLLADLGRHIPREDAVYWLEVILEAIVENYGEYIDYNSTTTQSDRGEMLYTLLDFLRLQSSYTRVAWNLRPVMLAHEMLVRGGRNYAAEIWRQAVIQRTGEIADEHQKRFTHLAKQYGMRLPSVAERLAERFVRPLTIDRLRSLIEPAIEELRAGGPTPSFETIQREIDVLTKEPAGVGFEVPRWLEALEDEVDEIRNGASEDEQPVDPHLPVAEVRLSMEDARRQIRKMLRNT